LEDCMLSEWIVLMRPTAFVGPWIQTSLSGSYQTIENVGEHSFVIQVATKSTQEVHTIQIKQNTPHNQTSGFHYIPTVEYFFVYSIRAG